MEKPRTRQVAIVGLILLGGYALYVGQTEITFGVVGGILALLKGEMRH